MATHPVSIMWDSVVALPWLHDVLIPPAPPVPMPSMDLPTTQFWALTVVWGKYSKKTFHMTQMIMLEGHDVGALVVHVTYPPSALIVLHALSSKRKFTFTSASVKIEGKATGVAALVPATSMMDCGDPVGNPLTVYPLNFFNTVHVGLTPMDRLQGMVGIAFDFALDQLINKFLPGKRPSSALEEGKEAARKTVAPSLTKRLLKKAVKKLAPLDDKAFTKWAIKNAIGNLKKALDPDAEWSPEAKIGIGINVLDPLGEGKKKLKARRLARAREVPAMPDSPETSSYDARAPRPPPATEPVRASNAPPIQSTPPVENLTP